MLSKWRFAPPHLRKPRVELKFAPEPEISQPPAGSPDTLPVESESCASVMSVKTIGTFLGAAKREGRLRRRRISVPMLASGGVLIAVGGLAFLLSILLPLLGVARLLTPFVMLGPCLAAWGLPLLLLALLPEDTYIVRLVIFVLHLVFILFFLVFGALTGVSLMGVIDVTDAPAWFRYCTSAWYGLLAGSYIVCACRTRGAWNADKSPRNILADAWRTLGLWYLSVALIHEVGALPRLAFDSKWKSSAEFVVLQTLSFELVAMGALALWPEFRMRMQALLASRGEGISAAAGISAIIGQASVESLLEVWETRFCGVDMDRVTRESMASNMPDPSLGALSRSVDFGAVDAFLSHSWHDDADSKWEAVQLWRSDFVAKFGREPVAWIDKYCIDQESIEDSLMCLPLFLCGCQKLVIFYGPTWPSRLWCVVESFLWLCKWARAFTILSCTSSPAAVLSTISTQCTLSALTPKTGRRC